MADKKKFKKNPIQTTPIGLFVFPYLSRPSYGSKDYPDPDGSYKVTLRLSGADAEALKDAIMPYHEEVMAEAAAGIADMKVAQRKELQKKFPATDGIDVHEFWKVVYDEDTEEPTGEIDFRFKMKASGKRKKDGSTWTARPGVFDAHQNAIPKALDIWGGTTGRIAFRVETFFVEGTGLAGCRLRLEAAQVTNLVSRGQMSADQYGFGDEDGFDVGDVDAEALAEAAEADAQAANADMEANAEAAAF